jgi:hypothetical protein
VDQATGVVDQHATAQRRAEPRDLLRMFHRDGYFGPSLIS